MTRSGFGLKGGLRAFLAGTSVLAMVGSAGAETPDAFWNAPWVQVRGGDTALIGAVSNGLRQANQTYFYGDRATKMVATIKGDTVDLSIVDQATGKVLARRNGLSTTGNGDVASSVRAAALAWMDGLNCGASCADAGGGPSETKVAAAPAAETPKETPKAAEKPADDPIKIAEKALTPKPETKVSAAPRVAAVTPDAKRAVAVPADRGDARKLAPVAATPKTDIAKTPVAEPKAAERTVVAAAPVTDTTPKAASTPEAGFTAVQEPKARVRLSEPTSATADTPGALALAGDAPTAGASDGEPLRLTPPKKDTRGERLAAITPDAPRTPRVATPKVTAPKVTAPTIKTPDVKAPDVKAPVAVAPEVKTPAAPKAETRAVTPKVTETARATATPKAPKADPAPKAVSTPKPDGVAKTDPPPADETAEETKVAAVEPTAPRADVTPGIALPLPRPSGLTVGAVAPAVPSTDTPSAEAATTADEGGAGAESGTEVAAIDPDKAASTFKPNEAEAEKDAALAAELDAALPKETEEVKTAAAPDVADLKVPGAGESDAAAPAEDSAAAKPVDEVETKVAAVDPTDEGPTLANARWIGFTPAVYTGSDERGGAWISGPFDRKQRVGWITDTKTGATTRVTFIWREAGAGNRTAVLSKEAARALGLGQGDVANVAVYLPR